MKPASQTPYKLSIIGYSKEAPESGSDKDKKVTMYQISISCPLRNWKVKRRFNDFFSLHEQLQKNYKLLPKIPQKTFFAVSSEGKIEKRRKELERYLTELLDLDLITSNVYMIKFLNIPNEFIGGVPQIRCKYEVASSLIFTDINYMKGRIINYMLLTKGLERPNGLPKSVPHVETLNQNNDDITHKSVLNGFKFDENEPDNIFQDKKIVRHFDLKAHCLQYFPEAAIVVAGFSKGVISIYKEEKKNKLDDEFQLTNITKFYAMKERITRILFNAEKGEMYVFGRKNVVKIIDMATWDVKGSAKIGTGPILSAAIDESYNLGLSTTEDGHLLIIDLAPEIPTVVKQLQVTTSGRINCMDCDIDAGKVICVAHETGEVFLIDIEFPFSPVSMFIMTGK